MIASLYCNAFLVALLEDGEVYYAVPMRRGTGEKRELAAMLSALSWSRSGNRPSQTDRC